MRTRRARIVFGVATAAYLSSVLQRGSLGVAAVEAGDRFHISASLLSTLAVAQLVVYAALQIPVGVLIDRVGPRALLAGGALLMAAGQTTLAFSTSLEVALVGRVLVGAGDAMTFVSGLRLINTWFSGPRVPVLSQWFANVGQLGQVLSAVPLSLVLHTAGWTPAFLGSASVAVVALVAVAVAVRDRPAGEAPPARIPWGESMRELGRSLRRPGTRLGFWSHFVTQSSGVVFSLLWGFPFLVDGLGYSPALASGLLIAVVASGMVVGPVIGILTGRFPFRRSNLVLGIVAMMGTAWAVVLLWPGVPPLGAVLLVIVAIGIGGPGSQVGLDFARTFNPPRSLGAASGVVNVGGFTASFTMMLLIGIALDAQDAVRVAGGAPSDLYSFDSFRLAFAVQYLVVGFGAVMLVRTRRSTRRAMADEGMRVGPLWVAYLERRRRRRA
jgi:sugar phosphate permease